MPWHGDKALWNSASMSYLLSTPNFLFNSPLSPKLIFTFQTTVVAVLFRTDNETLLKQNRGRGSSLAQMPSTILHYSLIWSPHIFRAILIFSPALRNPCFVPRDCWYLYFDKYGNFWHREYKIRKEVATVGFRYKFWTIDPGKIILVAI